MAFYQKNFALITGASSGIGKAMATELAQKKINLVLVALPGTGLEQICESLAAEHDIIALPYAADLTQSHTAEKMFQWCYEQHIVVRILINNAGIGNISLLEDVRRETIDTILRLNNYSMTMLTHAFLGQMKKHAPGFILNVGSLASFLPIPRKAVYAASKSFVYSFSCALRNELRDTGVSVSCLCPGSTQTSETVRQNLQDTSYKGDLFTQTSAQVAREAIKKMFQRKRRIIPGWQNKFLFLLWTILPYVIASAILIRIFDQKEKLQKPARTIIPRSILSIALIHR